MKKPYVVLLLVVVIGVAILAKVYFTRPVRLVAVPQGDPLAPVYLVTPNQIIVWRYFPRTPCSIGVDNPTCPAGDGIPTTINGACSDQSVCNPLSANDKLPPNKKIVSQQFMAAEGNLVGMAISPSYFKDCPTTGGAIGGCAIGWCRYEGATTGFGKFKNWAGDRDRTAALVAQIADK